MRRFACDRCGQPVPFEALECVTCGSELGYVSERHAVGLIIATDDPALYEVPGDDGRWWRCMNAAWGCNWMLRAVAGDVWCRSCRLTRGRPDEARPQSIDAWMAAEAAKRRLVHQLDSLGLPIEPRTSSTPDGLVFDFVHLPDEGAVTGHLDGVITLDLAEVDDLHRHRVRRELDEQFRTIIGHLRHEIGHHYWNRLVGESNHLAELRSLFGDDRADYGKAIAAHYATSTGRWDTDRYITAYAAVHPLEDWAETFAHYLHIVDATDTAVAHGLLQPSGPASFDVVALDFVEILARWEPVRIGINEVAISLGRPAVYPFAPSGLVAEKLSFVHRRVVAHSVRGRFYAQQ